MTLLIPAWVDGILQPVEKLEVHQRGLKHKAVSVFVFCDSQLLLQQRALEKYHSPGLWANTCCTHPDWGEDSLDCAHRRVSDELNMTALDLVYVDQIEYRADVGQNMIEHEVVDCFVATCKSRPKVSPNPDEVMDYTWVDPTKLKQTVSTAPASYTKWLQIYLRDHFETLFAKGCNAV